MFDTANDRKNRILRSLVVFNTGANLLALLAILSATIWFRDLVSEKLDNLFAREFSASRIFADVTGTGLGIKPAGNLAGIPVREFGPKIKEPHLRNIELLSRRFVLQGGMTDGDRVWFPAKFLDQGVVFDVKVRLRGDTATHWANQKKSWRIKFERGQLFEGYREINLVIGFERGYETELLAYDTARRLGLMRRDGGPATLRIKNVDMGDYIWFEELTRESLERMRLPEGNIVNADNSWLDSYQNNGANDFAYYNHASSYKIEIDDTANSSLAFEQWKPLLNLTRNGSPDELKAQLPRLVNLEKFAK